MRLIYLKHLSENCWQFQLPLSRLNPDVVRMRTLLRQLANAHLLECVYIPLTDTFLISDEGMWLLKPHFENFDALAKEAEQEEEEQEPEQENVFDDFDRFQRKYSEPENPRTWTFRHTFTFSYEPAIPSDVREAHTLLGLSDAHPSEAEIRAAFRARVKEAATGDGGYTGDMDALTKAKERAFAWAKTPV